jgi:hypothetical protein
VATSSGFLQLTAEKPQLNEDLSKINFEEENPEIFSGLSFLDL